MTEPTTDTHAGPSGPADPSWAARLAGPTASAPGRGSTLLRHLIITVLVVGAIMLATYRLQVFYDYQLAQIAAYFCAVAGLTVLTGLNGQVSLGHSALLAVGAYTVAMMQNAFEAHDALSQWSLLYSLAGAVVVTSVAGLVIGMAAARLRGPYLAGLTLAIVIVVPSIANKYGSLFHGDQGLQVPVLPPPSALGTAETFPTFQWQAWYATIAAGVTMFFLANLVRSRYGRQMRAVRDNEVAAQLTGLHVARTQVVAFVVSAACAGLAGGVIAAISQAVSPGSYGLTLSLYLLLAIVLGGLGSLAGAVWGSAAIVFLPYWTTKVMNDDIKLSPEMASKLNGNVPLAIFGLALIVIAIAAPGGIQGLLRRAGRGTRNRFIRRSASVATGSANTPIDTPGSAFAPVDERAAPEPPVTTPEVTG